MCIQTNPQFYQFLHKSPLKLRDKAQSIKKMREKYRMDTLIQSRMKTMVMNGIKREMIRYQR